MRGEQGRVRPEALHANKLRRSWTPCVCPPCRLGLYGGEISEAWAERARRRQDIFDGFHFYSLDSETTRIAFSLKLVAINYDCRNEKNEVRKGQKRSWARAWQDSVADGLGIDADGYFLSEEDAYGALETVSRRRGGKVRALLVAQELVEFRPYSQMGDEEKKEYKGLKESGSWVKHEFPRRQDAVDLDAIRSLEKRCGTRFRELSGTLPKLLVGGVIVVAAAVGAGGRPRYSLRILLSVSSEARLSAFTGPRLSMRALLRLAVGPWPPAAWAWPVALL